MFLKYFWNEWIKKPELIDTVRGRERERKKKHDKERINRNLRYIVYII